jgi:hypothetical protein
MLSQHNTKSSTDSIEKINLQNNSYQLNDKKDEINFKEIKDLLNSYQH